MINNQLLYSYAEELRLTSLKKEHSKLAHKARIENLTHEEYLIEILENEINYRQKAQYERRRKVAKLPPNHDLDNYKFDHDNGITRSDLKKLKQLDWIDQSYNLILMGPSGTGKTFIAGGLIHTALELGYKAYFRSMENILTTLKLKDLTSSAKAEYKRLQKAQLIAIDDIMMFPMEQKDSVALFGLINELHEKCSVIITTNKSPQEWVETMNDEVIASAMLDRLLYRCEVIKLKGKSYRLQNRQNIFDKRNE